MGDRNQPLLEAFAQRYGEPATHIAIGPGRVNLIGEHTDYNDGFVLPVALKRDVRLVMRPRSDRRVRMYSADYDESHEFELDELRYHKEKLWVNYVQGVAWALQEQGLTLTGLDGVIGGNVPRGSGLSSSAALEIAAAMGFITASNQHDRLSGPQVAQAAQRAENQFVGVNCGIMDQFISMLGAEDHALLIDCRSLEYERVPFPTNAALVIGNTKASRSLASSAYNQRRQECETGVAALQTVLPDIRALRDVSSEQLLAHRDLLSETVFRRCHHVVSENERVLQTVAALQADDLAAVGQLMNASHESLKVDYEVSSAALDTMVEAMRAAPGCYGARLTGAGFGGCAVALVEPGSEQSVADAIYEKYGKATNVWPEVYTSRAAAGARVEQL